MVMPPGGLQRRPQVVGVSVNETDCTRPLAFQRPGMGNVRIPPQYFTVGSLGFVAGWMSRGGKLVILACRY